MQVIGAVIGALAGLQVLHLLDWRPRGDIKSTPLATWNRASRR